MKIFFSKLKPELLKKAIIATKIILVFVFFYMIMVIIVSFFSPNGISRVQEISKTCHIGKKKYHIVMRSDGYYKCDNCSKKMKKEIIFKADWQKLFISRDSIDDYFQEHNGNCDI